MGPYAAGKAGALEPEPALSWQELRQTFGRLEQQTQAQELRLRCIARRFRPRLCHVARRTIHRTAAGPQGPFPGGSQLSAGVHQRLRRLFPTQQANREGGYGANWGETMHIEPRAGEAMIDAALAHISADPVFVC
jgi:hypothetical protein